MGTARLSTEPLKDLRRASEIVRVLIRHGFGYTFSQSSLKAEVPQVEGETVDPAKAGLPVAVRVRHVLEELGPTFVKLGQLVSTRADIVPEEYVQALKTLQDHAPVITYATAREMIESELGKPIGELFETFDEEPLATASIAQVHRATVLRDGEVVDVVCKVQRPGIEDTMASDLSLLYWLGRLLEETIEEVSAYSPTAIVEQFEQAVSEELDFVHERKNMERAGRNYADRTELLVVPEPLRELSSRRVLTMTYLDGIKVTDTKGDEQYDREALRDRLVEIAFKQVFEDGYFHGDPHPGNVFVLPDGRIGMLDYGLWGKLTSDQQDILIHWLTAIAAKSPSTLARLTLKIGEVPPGFDRLSYERDVRGLMDKYIGVELSDIDASSIITDSVEVIRRHRIKLPPDFAVLARATATLEGVIRELYPELDFQQLILPYVQRVVMKRLDLSRAGPEAMTLILGLQAFVNEVPSQMNQLLVDLSTGRFQVSVQGEAVNEVASAARTHGVRLVLSVLSASLILGTAITLAPFKFVIPRTQIPLVPVLLVLGLFVTGSGLGLSFLFPKGFQKIRLTRFLFWRRR